MRKNTVTLTRHLGGRNVVAIVIVVALMFGIIIMVLMRGSARGDEMARRVFEERQEVTKEDEEA